MGWLAGCNRESRQDLRGHAHSHDQKRLRCCYSGRWEVSLFLDDTELAQLTGRRMKSRQIAWLRREGIPFRVSATGHPVVTRAAIDSRQEQPTPAAKPMGWQPRVIAGSA